MADKSGKWLVETEWLAQHLNAPDLFILDASWHLPTANRNAHEEYLSEHIPGAFFFDIDEIADTDRDLPHMLPSATKFSSRMRRMGLGDGMRIVVYDTSDLFSAARVWWTFRVMGVEDVVVLNGGLRKWKAEGRPLEDLPPMPRTERHFTARLNRELIRDLSDMKSIVASNSAQIVDARPAARFSGDAPEPRPGLRGGHIPGSLNLPFNALVNEDGTFKTADDIKTAFKNAGVNVSHPIVTSCGSGVTASVLALALAIIGHRHTAVYDGSWSEWGANENLPLETGN